MLILKDHILAFTDGSADNANTKKGGYGLMLKFNKHEKIINHSCVKKTSNNKMEIQSVIEVFKRVKSTQYPLLIFTDSDYVYNCAAGNWGRKKNKEYWKEFDKVTKEFLSEGGKFRIYVVKSHLNLNKSSDIKEGLKRFNDKNNREDVKYLEKHSKRSFKTIFTQILRGNEIADRNACIGKDNAPISQFAS